MGLIKLDILATVAQIAGVVGAIAGVIAIWDKIAILIKRLCGEDKPESQDRIEIISASYMLKNSAKKAEIRNVKIYLTEYLNIHPSDKNLEHFYIKNNNLGGELRGGWRKKKKIKVDYIRNGKKLSKTRLEHRFLNLP